jgi:hypothetical protein
MKDNRRFHSKSTPLYQHCIVAPAIFVKWDSASVLKLGSSIRVVTCCREISSRHSPDELDPREGAGKLAELSR